jgi:tetratricopeptide (TPR) repeat protein
VHAELEQRRRDRRLLARLDEARLRWASAGDADDFDHVGADRQYLEAFGAYGLEVEQLRPGEAAARVRACAVAPAVLDALDDWAEVLDGLDPTRARQVRSVADGADDDPRRRRLRQACATRDRAALRRVVGEPVPPDRSPAAVSLFAGAWQLLGEPSQAREVLREAQRRRPGDFWLAFQLAHACDRSAPAGREEAVRCMSVAVALRPNSPAAHNNLGAALYAQGKGAEAEAEFRAALRLKPDDPKAHYNLGNALKDQGQWVEAEAEYRAALRLKPNYPQAHNNLGGALSNQGKTAEAEAEFREALRLKPDDPEAHYNLGNALSAQGQWVEAEAEYRAALRLKPDYFEAHNSLGIALSAQGKVAEAVAEFREALRLKLDDPQAHYNLGTALYAQGKVMEAVAELRAALRLKPNYFEAHTNLGIALSAQGQWVEAEAEYRAALRLKLDDPQSHNSLGNALSAQGKVTEAEAEYRQALRLKPDFPEAHYNLGIALSAQGKWAAAVAEYRAALRLKPDYPEAHCNLGHTLTRLGQFQPALEALRRGDALGRRQPGWRYSSELWVKQAERRVALDGQLPAFLRGDRRPRDAAERLELADLCAKKRLPAAAARFSADAFADQPRLAEALAASHRYHAACFAALAGSGQGEDDPRPDARERARLRGQAQAWLAADLALWARQADSKDAKVRERAQQVLRHWQQNADLSGLRHPWALWRLPADERKQWQQFWVDVDTLRQKAAAKD